VIAKEESVFDELQDMLDRIARRAYDIFTNNGRTVGRELDDWLEAENELVWEPSIRVAKNCAGLHTTAYENLLVLLT
jgi:hypothetical protein